MNIDTRLCSRPGNGCEPEVNPKIDPGIQRMVEILNSKGLETELSCEGHQDRQEMFCHYAFVTIRPKAYERYLSARAKKLKKFLKACPQVSLVVRYCGGNIAQPVLVFYVPNKKEWRTRHDYLGKTNHQEAVRTMMRRWEDAAERDL